MRVWDIPVSQLCNKHLVAQHHEIHCIYSIIVNNKKGFAHHPEVMRWRGHLIVLRYIHTLTVAEMRGRRFNHNSMLEVLPLDSEQYPKPWQPIEIQKQILLSKNCGCLKKGGSMNKTLTTMLLEESFHYDDISTEPTIYICNAKSVFKEWLRAVSIPRQMSEESTRQLLITLVDEP